MAPAPLPIDDVMPAVLAALADVGQAVLQAPPGAGKTTRVPLALLDAPWLNGQRILLLEPRRVAARAAAARLAEGLHSVVGGLVGYRMRDATKVSAATRIEVVTEGVLTAMLQSDPSLDGFGVVIFDEFHERSLQADLGLAFALEAKTDLRPDLRLLVMSATLDGERVADALGGAPIITSEGRQFPVETHYRPALSATKLEPHMAEVIADVARKSDGDILAFLPGAGWIRRTERLLGSSMSKDSLPKNSLPKEMVVTPLYGLLSGAEQDRAIAPDPKGRRKVILATDIAETSLTIDGVRVVVDGGQRRAPVFDPRSGLTRLETIRISKASADQRQGRAGRQAPGSCHRLWSRRDQEILSPFDQPEIMSADLTGLRLQLARWGARADDLAWLDAPPAPALAEATELLVRLGALGAAGHITAHGRAIAAFGTEPRLAHMLVRANEMGLGAVACDIAGLLSSRDPLQTRSVDMRERIAAMHDGAGRSLRHGAMEEAKRAAKRWRRQLGIPRHAGDPDDAGLVVSMAFGDRIGQQRGGSSSYRLASGRGAELPAGDALTGEPFLAVAEVDGDPQGGRIYLAAPLDLSDIERAHDDHIKREPVVFWDPRSRDVVAEHQTHLGALVFKREPMSKPPVEQLGVAWAQAVAAEGLDLLPFNEEIDRWRDRVDLLRRTLVDDWPDLTDAHLLATTDAWLAPHLLRVRRRKDLAQVDLRQILGAQLDWQQGRLLDELAPTHLAVPSGSNVRLDYGSEGGPVLAVRIQELFGLTETPTVVSGRVRVIVHLLSPAQRPMQVTTDLANFWSETYPQVKSELMGRYPKHYWPDDPLTAIATNRTKKRR